jgi:hypothetical protein
MLGFSQSRRRRIERRCRPMLDHASKGVLALEPRILLNASSLTSLHAARLAHRAEQTAARASQHAAATASQHAAASRLPKRLTPTQEINAQYAAFTTAFNNVLDAYVQSIFEPSTNTVPVSATVTVAYTTPATTILVNNASVFGPAGNFSPPVTATATLGTASLGTLTLTGSAGNLLVINLAQSTATNLPVGTVLSANVPVSAQSSAAAIFPSYITSSTTLMATTLVQYFNSIPIKLPAKNTPPHTPTQRGALQSYVYQNIAGSLATSLQQTLLAIPLPTTPGSDLQIYQAAVDSAIAQSRQYVLNGITEIFNRTLLVNAQAPANRLGQTFNTGTGSTTTGSINFNPTGTV